MKKALFISLPLTKLLLLGLLAGLATATHGSDTSSSNSEVSEVNVDSEKERMVYDKAKKALEVLHADIIKKITEDLERMSGVCRTNLRQLLGVSRPEGDAPRPFRATKEEADFCRRNTYSCCSGAEFQTAAWLFNKNLLRLKKQFEPVEEMLVLFEGQKYSEFVSELDLSINNRRDMCAHLDSNLQDPSGRTYTLTANTFIIDNVQEINSLLVEAQFFLKRQGWFYGNLICIACNPKDQAHFVDDGATLKLKTKMKTCQEILDMFEFELRLLKIYSMFLKPLADLHQCIQRADGNPAEPSLPAVDQEMIQQMSLDFEQCYFKIHPQNEKCTKICDKNPHRFVLNHQLRRLYATALEFFFPHFTGQTISQYYESIKDETFTRDLEIEIDFFRPDIINRKLFSMEYTEEGVNIFGNEMSKKYETLTG
jgi:hypothetical protein